MCEWHLGAIASCHAMMEEGISLAKGLNDMNSLALALQFAATIARYNPAEVERLASELIELSTRHNFSYWLTIGAMFRGWARSASGDTIEGVPWIEHGITEFRGGGLVFGLPFWLAAKAEALYLADRAPEALEAVDEAEAVAQRFEHGNIFSRLHWLRGILLSAMGAEQSQIEASFRAAVTIAREQKSILQEECAAETYAEYCRQSATALGGHGIRLPLW
jgi:hypothetical protein